MNNHLCGEISPSPPPSTQVQPVSPSAQLARQKMVSEYASMRDGVSSFCMFSSLFFMFGWEVEKKANLDAWHKRAKKFRECWSSHLEDDGKRLSKLLSLAAIRLPNINIVHLTKLLKKKIWKTLA